MKKSDYQEIKVENNKFKISNFQSVERTYVSFKLGKFRLTENRQNIAICLHYASMHVPKPMQNKRANFKYFVQLIIWVRSCANVSYHMRTTKVQISLRIRAV